MDVLLVQLRDLASKNNERNDQGRFQIQISDLLQYTHTHTHKHKKIMEYGIVNKY